MIVENMELGEELALIPSDERIDGMSYVPVLDQFGSIICLAWKNDPQLTFYLMSCSSEGSA